MSLPLFTLLLFVFTVSALGAFVGTLIGAIVVVVAKGRGEQ